MTEIGKRQVPRNLLMNILSFGVNIGAGLWLVPYLIGHLGTAAYGLVPLAMVFTQFVSVITQSFNVATGRSLTLCIQGKNQGGATAVFNTSLLVALGFVTVQALVCVVILLNLGYAVQIPAGLYRDCLWLFGFTFAGFLFSLIGSVFSISMYSHNRVDLMRLNDIARMVGRIATIITLFLFFGPALIHVGIGNFVGGLVGLAMNAHVWKKLTPELKISLRTADLGQLRPMAVMAGWILVNQLGYLLFLRIDTYVINRFIGPEACGEYAAVQQWNQLARTTAGVLSGAIAPLGMIYYARGEIGKLVRMMQLAVKLMALAMAAPLALLCVFSGEILALWLGEGFRGLGALMILQLSPLVVNLGVLPLFTINTALNRVKFPAILTFVLGGANLLLAILFATRTNWGFYGVAAAGVIVLTVKNLLFTPFYAAHILELPKFAFFRPLLGGATAFLTLSGLGVAVHGLLRFDSFPEIALALCFICIGVGLPIAWLGLSSEERGLLADFAPTFSRKFARRALLVRTAK
ncbi:MAG: oligosaccharide flippase family protein [Desulfuromonadales bacterium]